MAQQSLVSSMTEFVTLTATVCWCGVAFAAESRFLAKQREHGGDIFCPLGHRGTFKATDVQQLRDQLAAKDRELAHERVRTRYAQQEADRTERRRRYLKGQLTKAKKRVSAGVCPVADCHRHFENLGRHMTTKHPDYTAQDLP